MKGKLCMMAALLLMVSQGIQAQHVTRAVAHRGYWTCEGSAQNSLTSLQKAYEAGCWGSELDIWLTADGELVVNHDAHTLDGLVIEKTDSKQLLKSKLKNGETLPSLEAYLDAGKLLTPMMLVLELKTQSTPERNIELARKVVDMVKDKGMEDQVEYIAFSNQVGTELIRLAPEAKVAYLNGDKTPAELKELGYTGLDYEDRVLKAHEDWIDAAHLLGLTVNVWTVNDEDDLRYFIDRKADYITTNEPVLLLELLKR
ncbi:glycerophosphoryl diester phosphodiesterase [Barnesiella viscericola DSM 18177]|uniref:Glycerophosphoryl diester phosphodiesterase n=1 Tax=Barnesiella viscericola DSM 18177 TaxID=880074 RepID=W0EVC4_9BACT|nr:glycerophosphodiester phosphodiesterase family protein [Barnesiella viscericola]AHF13046.1 glycerophosphoryl diester phosphodiesterase [Barnesiella viscericola DSM 18177]